MGKTLEVVFEEDVDARDPRDAPDSRDWCVELGDVLAAMASDELVDAIDRGDVTPTMRVWRLGLDGWTPVEQLPELARK